MDALLREAWAPGAAAACFHCGEPVEPATAVHEPIDGESQAFCCTGCAAAARWIGDARLGDYYRLRDATGSRVETFDVDYTAWDREDVVAGHVHPCPGGREIVLLTDGMHCAACAWLIDRALRRENGVLDAGANAITGRVRIAWDPTRTPLSRVLSRMASLGYRPYLAAGGAQEVARARERNRWLLRIGIAGLGAMQAMMFAEALYLDTAHAMPGATRDFFRWLALLVSAPVVFYSGWPFLAGMARELRQRRAGMDSLVSLSVLVAFLASAVETLRHGAQVWYDAAVMFVFLLLCARMLEERVRRRATAQVDALARARPALAVREIAGVAEQVPLDRLQVGDVIRVAPGETVPADGELLDDEGAFDEALLNGESVPLRRGAGDPVYAGSLCHERPARLRVTGVGNHTRLSELARLADQAQTRPVRLARLGDRIAAIFVPLLVACALATYAWWHVHAPARAFEVALAVLVVSCPCALSLAIPAALAVAQGALSRIGVLPLHGDAIDTLARADVVIFDKTGTLGDGRPMIDAVEAIAPMTGDRALQAAATLERHSRHPLARAFAGIASSWSATGVQEVAGEGIAGIVDGRPLRLGRRNFVAPMVNATDMADADGLWMGDGTQVLAHITLREGQREGAAAAVAALRVQGLAVQLCSGDGRVAVERLASSLGIAEASFRQRPEHKLARVRELQSRGRVVAMVGDGLNDAPVLAGADVSFAMSDGAALAQRAADFVVTSPSLLRIPQAIVLARRTHAVVRQNLAWALLYNAVALPLAATGHVSPWMAALGMAGSSLLVTLNALRLARMRVTVAMA